MDGKNDLPQRITLKGWLSEDEFKKLIKFSDYRGTKTDGSKEFVLNLDKAKMNGVSLDEIREMIRKMESSGRTISSQQTPPLDSNEKMKAVFTLEGNRVILKPNFFLKGLLGESSEFLSYDKVIKAYIVPPAKLFDVIEKLSSKGVEIDDKTSVMKSLPLSFKVELRTELRDYQREALDKWIENDRRGIIALPTGSGKTVIAIAAIAAVQERTLIITYTKEQLNQWIDMITKFTNISESMVSPFYSEEKRLAPITVSTYQTAFRYIDLLSFRYSFLIVDEVHHLPADKFRTIALGMYSPVRMGLSATVIREDGRHVDLFPLMGGIVYYKTPQEMVEKGYLAPYETFIVRVRLTDEERMKYERLREAYKNITKGMPFKEVLAKAQRGNPVMARALKIHNEMLQIYQKAKEKEKAVVNLVKKELEAGSKILIFTQYVDQAEELGKILGAKVLTGSTDPKLRKKILEEFRETRTGVLVLTTVGDEGIDIPDVNVGIIVAGTGSRRQFVQRLGRLLRPGPGKVAKLYEIVTSGTAEEAQMRKRKKLSLDIFGAGKEDGKKSNEGLM
ncbi:MAG TPA: DEAD/DEAH box helicase [Fervidicoccus fontis]|jgi:superfamily II DNA or RNA helicase|uniref:DEAD/DEAH box helicase n=1 Tax=Fervidicoccus fontis TaxID=683846 RepID=A0A7C2YZ07_9CREN|nr:MAG: DNA methylase [Fervidicoccus sp.]HEU97313.1 DEAD/DEAH box helicase [Fervidicoccus fontis]